MLPDGAAMEDYIMNSLFNDLVDFCAGVIGFLVSGGLAVLGVYIAVWYAKNFSENKNFFRNILIIAAITLGLVLIAPNIVTLLFNNIKM
jgi:hypothetical protein